MKNKFAFTLAEVMIVLVVIGVLSAVLIPAALNSGPNEDIAKFKNGHNAFLSAIRELVTSDKYYLDGDLGVRADGRLMYEHSTDLSVNSYFCKTFSDVISATYVDCINTNTGGGGQKILNCLDSSGWAECYLNNNKQVTPDETGKMKIALDSACKTLPYTKNITAKQFVTSNGVWYFNPSPGGPFGTVIASDDLGVAIPDDIAFKIGATTLARVYSSPHQKPTFHDDAGMDTAYKVLCMDIDGVPDNATKDDCVNECPFGYGVRADGKILNGARADEWLEKSISQKD